MNHEVRDTPANSPHDYDRALQKAVSWLGDRYLLAKPLNRHTADHPKYWTAAQHAAAFQAKATRRQR